MKAGKYTKLEEEIYTTKQLSGQFRKVIYHLNTWFERMLSDVPEVIPDLNIEPNYVNRFHQFLLANSTQGFLEYFYHANTASSNKTG